ncbi:hypothetical protein L1887_51854 [Cichorium endivia]|nr:hypothetical protein L1887_51854 [Cichorium endivia]
MDTRFYCDPCLSSRIAAHHNEIRRLSLAKDKARQSVEMLLSDRAHSEAVDAIPSPLLQPRRPVPSATLANAGGATGPFQHHGIRSYSCRLASQHAAAAATRTAESTPSSAQLARSEHPPVHRPLSAGPASSPKEALQEQQASIVLRKHNLAKSWSSLEGSSAVSSPSASQRARHANKSRWLTHPAADPHRYPHSSSPTSTPTTNDRTRLLPQTPPQSPSICSSAPFITRSRLQLASLQAEATAISAELANARATLAPRCLPSLLGLSARLDSVAQDSRIPDTSLTSCRPVGE